jgi:hypothetical protein
MTVNAMHLPFVTPAQAGVQSRRQSVCPSIPAFAGMTIKPVGSCSKT